MAYTAWSVVFGEQPTAAKWNQLGQNDAGFKDGTNFDNTIIKRQHMDFSTFLFRSANVQNITTFTAGNFSGTSTRSSQSFTMPAGTTKALVIAGVRLQSQVSAANDMTSRVDIGAESTNTGIVTGVGTFAAGYTSMFGVMTVVAGSNTVNLVCTAGSSASVSNYKCMIIPLDA